MIIQGIRQGSFPLGHVSHEAAFSLTVVAVLGGVFLLKNSRTVKQQMTNVHLGWSLQRSFLSNKKEIGSRQQSQSSSFVYVEKNQIHIFLQLTLSQRPMLCMALRTESALEHLHKRIICPSSDQIPVAADGKEFSLIFCVLVTCVLQVRTEVFIVPC